MLREQVDDHETRQANKVLEETHHGIHSEVSKKTELASSLKPVKSKVMSLSRKDMKKLKS